MIKQENDKVEDSMVLEDEYKRLQQQFKVGYEISQKLFLEEQDQRQAMAFYQRRNNAMLEVLSKVDTQPNSLISIDKSRISKIIEQSPRLSKTLTPLLEFTNESKLDKLHYVNLFINESLPELINDDLSSIEINPQNIESWIRRQKLQLISKNFKPIDIPATGIHQEYIGHDCPPPEDETVTKTNKKKRKAPAEAGKKKVKT